MSAEILAILSKALDLPSVTNDFRLEEQLKIKFFELEKLQDLIAKLQEELS